jgi:hypothetical protein
MENACFYGVSLPQRSLRKIAQEVCPTSWLFCKLLHDIFVSYSLEISQKFSRIFSCPLCTFTEGRGTSVQRFSSTFSRPDGMIFALFALCAFRNVITAVVALHGQAVLGLWGTGVQAGRR